MQQARLGIKNFSLCSKDFFFLFYATVCMTEDGQHQHLSTAQLCIHYNFDFRVTIKLVVVEFFMYLYKADMSLKSGHSYRVLLSRYYSVFWSFHVKKKKKIDTRLRFLSNFVHV